MKVVTFFNQKGGVGKTTACLAFGYGLAERGHRVCFVDLDTQGNLSLSLKAPRDTRAHEIFGIQGDTKVDTFIYPQYLAKNLEIITFEPSKLVWADTYLANMSDRYEKATRLMHALFYMMACDYVLIDCPPYVNMLTINALTASTHVLVPCQCDIYSLQSLSQVAQTIADVRRMGNSHCEMDGVILTRYSARSKLSMALSEKIEIEAQRLGSKLYKPFIRECVAIKEAQALGLNPFLEKSNASKDFDTLITSILNDIE